MSEAFVNPLSRCSPAVVTKAREIKNWTRKVFDLPEDAVVSVSELACHVPGCPPKETVVLMMVKAQTVQISIHKAMHDLTEDDIEHAFSSHAEPANEAKPTL